MMKQRFKPVPNHGPYAKRFRRTFKDLAAQKDQQPLWVAMLLAFNARLKSLEKDMANLKQRQRELIPQWKELDASATGTFEVQRGLLEKQSR